METDERIIRGTCQTIGAWMSGTGLHALLNAANWCPEGFYKDAINASALLMGLTATLGALGAYNLVRGVREIIAEARAERQNSCR